MNDTRKLEARLRQVLALDRNAHDVYSSLASLVSDAGLAASLRRLAADESRHQALWQEALGILEDGPAGKGRA